MNFSAACSPAKRKRMKSNVKKCLWGLFLLAVSSSGCDPKTDCCTNIDTDVRIHYVTSAGANLINSTADFKEENIKVYYKNGEAYEYIYHGNLDYPNMHYVYENEKHDRILTVFPSNYYENNYSTTLIKLNEQTVDTLFCAFELSGNSEVCTNAWLNGVQMEGRFIEVMK